ncbi:MAG: response regulator [Terricaulis sp.]|jgi:CheY-like chemotaxis protein
MAANISSLDILIVDDHDPMRAILEKALRAAGASVVRGAEDAGQALALLAERPADLVIADLMMPGMDGLAFVAALRADARLAHARIVMITGYANVADEARTAGADVVLLKPITPAELLAAVETALTQH